MSRVRLGADGLRARRHPDGDGTHREVCVDRLAFDEETGAIETVTPTLEGIDPVEPVAQAQAQARARAQGMDTP